MLDKLKLTGQSSLRYIKKRIRKKALRKHQRKVRVCSKERD
jgi:hypothetical protein